MINRCLILISALTVFALAGGAQAASVSCAGNKHTISYEGNTAEQSTAVCAAGNLDGSSDLTFNSMTFGLGINDQGNSVAGSPLSWLTDPMSTMGGTGLRNWGITLASDWIGKVVLELKQSDTYSLFDVTGSCDFTANSCIGTWSTSGPAGSTNDLSHTRAWYKDGPIIPPAPVVPLPAAGWMLVAGLFGLGAMRRSQS